MQEALALYPCGVSDRPILVLSPSLGLSCSLQFALQEGVACCA